MISLYGQYIKERGGVDILEDDHGFATFKFIDKDTCYIVDIFVVKEMRRNNKASDYAKEIEIIAKERGCKYMLGSLSTFATNFNASEALMKANGYKFKETNSKKNMVYYLKEL